MDQTFGHHDKVEIPVNECTYNTELPSPVYHDSPSIDSMVMDEEIESDSDTSKVK